VDIVLSPINVRTTEELLRRASSRSAWSRRCWMLNQPWSGRS